MEIIEYEPINLYDGRFCKVFHSDWIQLEKPKDVNSAPHFHWHNSFEFNCSISGTLRCEIGSTMTYAKDTRYLPLSDSLFSYYIGYRCEVEVTAFASPLTESSSSCSSLSVRVCFSHSSYNGSVIASPFPCVLYSKQYSTFLRFLQANKAESASKTAAPPSVF